MATTAADSIFVDTNILVYADLTSSPYHALARQRLTAAHAGGAQLWISRQVVREYLVVITRGQTFATPVPPADAAASVAKILGQLHVADESGDVTDRLLELLRQFGVSGKQIHDANIVATMLAHGVRHLLTHNTADFARYHGLIDVLPLVV
jgi:predicted nucleic acid-binding protein